jgi:hypothetical protein
MGWIVVYIIPMSNTPPINWQNGFSYYDEWTIGCGGDEEPMQVNGKWYLYVWNRKRNVHGYYSYSDDIVYNDDFIHTFDRKLAT